MFKTSSDDGSVPSKPKSGIGSKHLSDLFRRKSSSKDDPIPVINPSYSMDSTEFGSSKLMPPELLFTSPEKRISAWINQGYWVSIRLIEVRGSVVGFCVLHRWETDRVK